jgi:hypothetical protein
MIAMIVKTAVMKTERIRLLTCLTAILARASVDCMDAMITGMGNRRMTVLDHGNWKREFGLLGMCPSDICGLK